MIIRKTGQLGSKPVLSSHPNSHFKVINISDSPRYSSSDFDIVEELTTNRSHYLASEGDPSLSILSLPSICTVNVERLRQRVAEDSNSPKKPGQHATFSACIYYGVSSILDNNDVAHLLAAKTRMNLFSADTESKAVEIINGMFSTYTMCTNLPKGKRFNCFIPSHIHSPLSSLANDLSSDVSPVHIQTLAVIAIMHTLTLQPDTLDDHREKMEKIVSDFMESIKYLNRAVRAVIREFKI